MSMMDGPESALRPLVGRYLTRVGRAVDLEAFCFDPVGDGADNHDLAGRAWLHVQCSWRILRAGRILVGYTDMVDPPSDWPGGDFDPNASGPTRRDELTYAYIDERQANRRRVVTVETSARGDATITFDDDTVLELFPDAASPGVEYWRLLAPDGSHAVMTGAGLERLPPKPRPG
jgi:hypothetical protein